MPGGYAAGRIVARVSTPNRHAFVVDVPDLSTFAFPDGGPEDTGEAAPPTSRIQVAKVGKFAHPRYGKFSVTRDTFDRFIANLAAGITGDRLPMDFDHEPDMGGSTAACGWITALEADGDQLYATVEWLWDGAWAIKEQRYRWISPTWSMNYTDDAGATHGPTMIAAALTNRPYFSRMAAVSLSSSFSATFASIPEATVEEPEPARYDRVFATALAGLKAEHRSVVADAYARDPRAGLNALELLLPR